ncbi:MAG: universal stress protein [Campylobacterota bacterium]
MTILVAVDISDTGMRVLSKAAVFADRYGAQLNIIHVIEDTWYTLNHDIRSIGEQIWKRLRTISPSLKRKDFHCVEGNAVREICALAETVGADLILLGSSGENYIFRELLVGSTTKNIVRDSPVPVLVVKNDSVLQPERILIPTNLSEYSKNTIFKTAALFPTAELILFKSYILPFEGRLKTYGFSEEDIIDLQMQIREREDEDAEVFVRSLNVPAEKIHMITRKGVLNPPLFLEAAASYQTDLIAVHTTGSFSFFTFDLLEESNLDVLICPF